MIIRCQPCKAFYTLNKFFGTCVDAFCHSVYIYTIFHPVLCVCRCILPYKHCSENHTNFTNHSLPSVLAECWYWTRDRWQSLTRLQTSWHREESSTAWLKMQDWHSRAAMSQFYKPGSRTSSVHSSLTVGFKSGSGTEEYLLCALGKFSGHLTAGFE